MKPIAVELKHNTAELYYTYTCIIQNYSRITHGRVLNGELYAQRLQKVIYMYLFTDYFMHVSDEWREVFMKQSVNKLR